MSRREPPNEAQEVVQRVRCRYTKSGRMRFASHRDFQRSLERAIRRAGVPIAFSGGFSPRPRISYANAAPTGTASRAEYLEIGLREQRDLDQLQADISAALPSGFDMVEMVPAGPGKLADRLTASTWELELRGTDPEDLDAAVASLLAEDQVIFTRLTKSGRRQVDMLPAWAWHDVSPGDTTIGESCAILRVVVRHLTPAIRPDDILTVVVERTDLEPPSSAIVTRLAQGPLQDSSGILGDPLLHDQDVAEKAFGPASAGPQT